MAVEMASLADATLLLTLLLFLSPTGKWYDKNLGECDLLPFSMLVEFWIKHHQFRLLSHFILN
jgi:hypothetical protein